MIEYKIPINKLRSCLQKTGENHSQNDLSTENERQKALDALERIEKTLYSFWNRPEKPEVFGLPPIDFETIRAALQSPRVPVIDIDECVQRYIAAFDEIAKDYLNAMIEKSEDLAMDLENVRDDADPEEV